MTPSEEHTYINQAIQGDPHAFEALVNAYKGVVAATVYGMLGRCAEAEDVGQEVFIRLYKSLGKFRGEASLKTYVTRIAMNLSLNELKRRKRTAGRMADNREAYDRTAEIAGNTNIEAEYDSKEVVEKALCQLEEKHRAVVVLRLIDGYSTKEVAKLLKLPVGTVLSRLSRAQEKLKKAVINTLSYER